MLDRKVELYFALVMLALGVAAAVFWVPLDSETPPIYTFRRQTYIGDAMLPMVAAVGISIFAAIHLALTSMRPNRDSEQRPFDGMTGLFFLLFFGILAVSFLLMYWAGPIAVELFVSGNGEDAVTYREMRGTAPWKYLGFILGGFTMVFGITTLIEGKATVRRALSSILAVAVLMLLFDVPFDTILIPPNGDF